MIKTDNIIMSQCLSELGRVGEKEGKFLIFRFGEEEYGMGILEVREIIGQTKITGIPGSPPYFRGIIDLRGAVIPVIDLKKILDIRTIGNSEESCIIVVEMTLADKTALIGIIVDSVSEVLDIGKNEIEKTPRFGAGVDMRHLLGFATKNNKTKILLNIYEILTGENSITENLLQLKNSTNGSEKTNLNKRRDLI
jgi:purine-binding chemotaxis protein CheW